MNNTAFTPSLLSIRSTPRATATAPIPAVAPSRPSKQLKAYEQFLQNCPPSQRAVMHAPVYETAHGTLVCEWDAQDAKLRRTLQALQEYEQFLNSDAAGDIDKARPVFLSQNGLVCQYP